MELTSRQKEVLEIIINYIERHNYPPSLREVMNIVGLKSASTIHGIFLRLKQKGYLEWEPSRPRTLRIIKKVS